jgi:membrane protease YdiL (CAAX protease family)
MYRTLASLSLVFFVIWFADQPEYKYPNKSMNLLLLSFLVVGISAWIFIEYMQTAKNKRGGILGCSLAFSGIFTLIVLPMPFLGKTEGKNFGKKRAYPLTSNHSRTISTLAVGRCKSASPTP